LFSKISDIDTYARRMAKLPKTRAVILTYSWPSILIASRIGFIILAFHDM
jgi:hypothetical protein